ncbi:MAG: ABC transporter ATP-binding protein [Betaproteobacteria bacterium]|nr:ABC transporter ATP-binding protein [Betaproteobacteria bacterium]MDE2003834.1 ABC transporter ATP-binding protein [Betaproteobacteria bacterium]MDE2209071.1 ABC transporter ATP-binding protein [Betaproteobacteria bacterium]MDE2358192.1 ABC transporter ATP-binding protein [Betaproteobacteria bacterium]
MSIVTVESLRKLYPGHGPHDEAVLALDEVSFGVADCEFCSILGHSGCGKTTLLMMMAGFEAPSGGRILVDGRPVGRPTWRRSVVFQEYALFPWMTVEKNIAFGLEMKRIPREAQRGIVAHNVELVGLQGFEHRYPHQLSGGMKQRVSIARALAVDPEVLLMDEPFAALDAQNRSRMQEEMGRILASNDPRVRKTMVLVTHSIEEAILLSDHVVVLTRRPGRVKAQIRVELPRPRRETDPDFVALKQRIRDLIHDEFEPER